mgnify:CR=1 FL=1
MLGQTSTGRISGGFGMKAYICDRCGKTITMEEVTAIKKDFPTAFHVIDFEWVDVCPDCCS